MNQHIVQKLRSLSDRMSMAGVILLGTLPERLFTLVFGELRLHVPPTPKGVAAFAMFCTNPAYQLGPAFLEQLFSLRTTREELAREERGDGTNEYVVLWRSMDQDEESISLGEWMHEHGYRRRDRLRAEIRKRLVDQLADDMQARPPSMISSPSGPSYEDSARQRIAETYSDNDLEGIGTIYERLLDGSGLVPDAKLADDLLDQARAEYRAAKEPAS